MTNPSKAVEAVKLEACPFCGCAPVLCENPNLTDHYFVMCTPCNADGPEKRTSEEAVAAWNTRTLPPSRIKPDEADVERVARALCKVTGAPPDLPNRDGNPRWQGWAQYARAALSAMPTRPDDGEEVLDKLARIIDPGAFGSYAEKREAGAIKTRRRPRRAIARDKAQRILALTRPAGDVFDLLEGLSAKLLAQGDQRGFEMKGYYARGTGGMDVPTLIDILTRPAGGEEVEKALALVRLHLDYDFADESNHCVGLADAAAALLAALTKPVGKEYDPSRVYAEDVEREAIVLGLEDARACFNEGDSDYANIQAAIDFINPRAAPQPQEGE